MGAVPNDPPNPWPLRTKPEFNDELISCAMRVARDDDGAAARRIAELLELDDRDDEAVTWWKIARALGDRDAALYLAERGAAKVEVSPEAHAFADVLDSLASDAVDMLTDAISDSWRTATGAAAMQLNQYAFWVRRGWVDPLAVTGVLLAGRRPGMTLPGDADYPFAKAP